MQYEVTCDICGKRWAEQDPGVRYVYGDGVWECSEESACFDRKAMNEIDQEVKTGE